MMPRNVTDCGVSFSHMCCLCTRHLLGCPLRWLQAADGFRDWAVLWAMDAYGP